MINSRFVGRPCRKRKCKKCDNVKDVCDTSSSSSDSCKKNICCGPRITGGAVIPFGTGFNNSQVYLETDSLNGNNPLTPPGVESDILVSIGLIGFGEHSSVDPISILPNTPINFSADTAAPPLRLYNYAFVAPQNGILRNLAVNYNDITVSSRGLPSNYVINLVGHIYVAPPTSNVYTPTPLRVVIPMNVINSGLEPRQPVFLSGPFAGVDYSRTVSVSQQDRILFVAYVLSGSNNLIDTSIHLKANISAGLEFDIICNDQLPCC